jgi:hypothetical protein
VSDIWSIEGDRLDRGYLNLKTARYPEEQEMREQLSRLWSIYEPYADAAFRQGFARDPNARFWEMYLGCRLIEGGKNLLPAADRPRDGGQPDICVLDGERRIWIEAIAPEPGDGEDAVRGPQPINEGGGFGLMPVRQAQLRMTSALWKKKQAIDRYMQEGIIGLDDVRLIAIGAGSFGIYVTERPLPLILSSVFPIGDAYVTLDRQTGEVVRQGYEQSYEIARRAGPIKRTAFLDETFATVSGVIWSRISIGNMSQADRPLTLVHNPLATVPMQKSWGSWDREFVTVRDGDYWQTADILA